MSTVVISQPMFLPWVGIFQQINRANFFIHYDDAQIPQGRSFISRVQIKSKNGVQWLTVPIKRISGQLIRDVKIDSNKKWKSSHLGFLHQTFHEAPFKNLALNLVDSIYSLETDSLSELSIHGIKVISNFLNLSCNFSKSSEYNLSSKSTQKLVEITKAKQGEIYLTGHGAKNYLEHNLFEDNGISVHYIKYNLERYPQLHGEFTPYVSIIDMIANMGEETIKLLSSDTTNWKDFIK